MLEDSAILRKDGRLSYGRLSGEPLPALYRLRQKFSGHKTFTADGYQAVPCGVTNSLTERRVCPTTCSDRPFAKACMRLGTVAIRS